MKETSQHHKCKRAKTGPGTDWTPGPAAAIKKKGACRCGTGSDTTPPHTRVSSLQCPLNRKSKKFTAVESGDVVLDDGRDFNKQTNTQSMTDMIDVETGIAILDDDGADDLGALDTMEMDAMSDEMDDDDDEDADSSWW
jgi:hypothetical protein